MKYIFIALVLICSESRAQKIGSTRLDPVTFRVLEEATDGGLPYATDTFIAGFRKERYMHWYGGDEWITIANLDSLYRPLSNKKEWWFCWSRFDKRIKSDTAFGKLTIVVFTEHGDSLRDKNVYMITQNSARYYLDEDKKPFTLAEKDIGEGSEYFRAFTPIKK